jgi:hypothetical protein
MTSDFSIETDDLDEFLRRLDEALAREFGPDHQAVLSRSCGGAHAEFEW